MDNSHTKLVFLVPRFYPFKGGAEQNAYQLAKRAAAEGYAVTVLTTDATPDGQPLAKTETNEGIHIIRLHRWNQQLNLGFYPGLFWKLLRTDADIIHVENGPGFIWQEYCLFWKKLVSRHTKFIVTPHGPFLAATGISETKSLLRGMLKKVMGVYFRILWPWLFDIVIQVNPKQSAWLTQDFRIPQSKIRLLPNGIDAKMIVPHKRVSELAHHPVVITYVGRFEAYKGVQQLLQALAGLRKLLPQQPQFKLIAMGRGPYLPQLQDLTHQLALDDIVEFIVNPTDNNRDTILYSRSQIHVLPSQWEATGIVLLEAMAKGNAIVTTTGNEAADLLITEGQNGYIYDYDNIEKLTTLLRIIISDDNLRQKMIDENLVKVRDYTWENIFPTYVSILRSLS